ncbi:MAG: iron chelate uptake ABC transporter family permease subunit, partial [Cellulomonadaceae bacterium]
MTVDQRRAQAPVWDAARPVPWRAPRPPSARRGGRWLLVAAAALVLSVLGAVLVGPADLRPAEVLASVLHHLGLRPGLESALRDGIVWQGRLPRALTAAAVGAGLAVCGVVMQSLTRNPLADPYLLGLSSGASLGAVLVIAVGVPVLLPVAAFGGSVGALVAALALAGALGAITPTRTVL